MKASTRAALTTGFTALSLGVLAVVASIPPESMRTIQVVRSANVTDDLVPGVVPEPSGVPAAPPSEEDLDSALALIEQLAPVTNGRVVTVSLGGHDDPKTVTIAPAGPTADDAALPDGGSANVSGQQAVDDPIAHNEASDLIDRIYSISSYWSNYLATELVPWLINWVPFGYLVSDQILIWYPTVVQPTVSSFVYDFLDPVVNDPTNPTVWTDGIAAVTTTAANGIANGIAEEVNYIVTFGWFPIPLPPLPNLPLPGVPSASSSASASVATAAALSDSDNDTGTAETGTTETSKVAADTVDAGTEDGATPGGTTEDDSSPAGSEPVDTDATEVTSDNANEGGSADQGTGERVAEPAQEADDTARVTAEGSAAEPAVEEAAEAGEMPESLIESGDATQSSDDAGSTTEAGQGSATGPAENSADDETSDNGATGSATADSSTSEDN